MLRFLRCEQDKEKKAKEQENGREQRSKVSIRQRNGFITVVFLSLSFLISALHRDLINQELSRANNFERKDEQTRKCPLSNFRWQIAIRYRRFRQKMRKKPRKETHSLISGGTLVKQKIGQELS